MKEEKKKEPNLREKQNKFRRERGFLAPSHNSGLRFIYKMVPSLFTHSLSILWRKQVLNED